MKNDLGVYAKNKDGALQRRLLTVNGEAPLPDSTPGAEVIDFSELNFHYYAVIIDQLITCQPFLIKADKGRKRVIDNNVYEFMADMANNLVNTIEQESPLFGTLTRTALEDNLPKDDGTRAARCECCGRFFIPRTRAATKYCDRVIRDGKTCKQLAPIWKHQRQTKHDEVIGAFDRVKRRMYKRYERALNVSKKPSPRDISYAEYYGWLKPAAKARDDYLAGKLTAEQALAVIEAEPVREAAQ